MTADVPVVEVEAVDAVLDALDTPTSSEVYSAVEPFSNSAVAAAAAARAIAGGGGGGSQTLAQVLTAGGDPAGNPITGPLEIEASASGATALTVTTNPDFTNTTLVSLMGGDGTNPFAALEIGGDGAATFNTVGQSTFGVYSSTDASLGDRYALLEMAGGEGISFNLDSANFTTFEINGDAGRNLRCGSNHVDEIICAAAAGRLGFYGTAGIPKQTGVAVTDAGIHAALVNLGLIAA